MQNNSPSIGSSREEHLWQALEAPDLFSRGEGTLLALVDGLPKAILSTDVIDLTLQSFTLGGPKDFFIFGIVTAVASHSTYDGGF